MNVETVPLTSLTPDPQNARKHNKRNLDAIAASLNKFGQRKPIVVTHDGTVIAGNGTLEAATSLGWKEISIARAPEDWDDNTVRAYALADNQTGALAEWDDEILNTALEELTSEGWDIAELGFDLNIDVTEPLNGDLDIIPEPPAMPKTKMGDIYQLGNHRLICGDSNKTSTINRLLQGIKLDAIIQDPPYGVLDVEWDRPLSQTDLDVALENCDGPIFMFNATKPKLFADVLNLQPQADRIMVWRMTAGITGKGGMFWTWQPVFVWNANRKMIGWDSIEFESAAPDRTGEHLTQKPIGLIEKYINSIPEVKTIGDFFMGSGTTLLAAEKTGKTCYGVELDPKYCDVIVSRWELATGKTAVLL